MDLAFEVQFCKFFQYLFNLSLETVPLTHDPETCLSDPHSLFCRSFFITTTEVSIPDMYFLYQLMCLLSQAHDEAGRQRSKDLLQRWGGGGAGGVLHLHPQPRGHAGGGGRRARGLPHLPRPRPEGATALQVSSSYNITTTFQFPSLNNNMLCLRLRQMAKHLLEPVNFATNSLSWAHSVCKCKE